MSVDTALDLGVAFGRAERARSVRIYWTPSMMLPPGLIELLESAGLTSEDDKKAALGGWQSQICRFARGQGSIDQLDSGSWRVRLPSGGSKQITLGPYDSWAYANVMRRAALNEMVTKNLTLVDEKTLRQYGDAWLDRKAMMGKPSAATYRNKWDCHVAKAKFIDWRLGEIERADVQDWIDGLLRKKVIRHGETKQLAPVSVHQIVMVLGAVMRAAVTDRIIEANPVTGQELPEVEDDLGWDERLLEREEQEQLLSCEKIPTPDRLIIGIALGTGLRAQELTCMPLMDIEAAAKTGRMRVRFGSPGRKPKNGIREVEIVPRAVDLIRAWLAQLDDYCARNYLGLAFPTVRGARRMRNAILGYRKKDSLWWIYQAEAGIKNGVTWHGLRKTCGSSLYSGLWDRQWSLQEVANYLGDTLEVTVKHYAHVTRGAQITAATQTPGGPVVQVTNKSRTGASNDETASKQAISELSPIRYPDSRRIRGESEGYTESDLSRDLIDDLDARIQEVRRQIRDGRASPADFAAFIGACRSSLKAELALLEACDRATVVGPHQSSRVLDVARDFESRILALKSLSSKTGGVS